MLAGFTEIKSVNPKLKQDQKGGELGCSSSTLQRSRYDKKMQCPYKSNDPKRTQNTSSELKKPQLILGKSSPLTEMVRPNTSEKNKLTGGSMQEIDDE